MMEYIRKENTQENDGAGKVQEKLNAGNTIKAKQSGRPVKTTRESKLGPKSTKQGSKPVIQAKFGQVLQRKSAPKEEEPPGKHKVTSGESIQTICKQYSISEEEFKYWNRLPNDKLKTGAEYFVAPPAQHKVQPGDTLAQVAKMYRISISELKKLNGLSSDEINIPVLKTTSNYSEAGGSTGSEAPSSKPPMKSSTTLFTPTNARPTVNANSGNTSSGTVAEPTRRVPVEQQQVIVDKTTSDVATTKEIPPVKSISDPTIKGTVGNILNKGVTPTATKETITTKEEVVVKDDTKSGEDSESKVVKTEVKPTAKRITPTESKPLDKSTERSNAGIHPPPTLTNSSASTSARPTVETNSGNTSSGTVAEPTRRVPVEKQQVIVDKTTSDAATTKETPPVKSISGPTVKGTVGNILNKGLTPTATKETITTKEEVVVKDDTKSGEDSESKVVKTEVKPTAKRITPTESKPLNESTERSNAGIHPPPTLTNSSISADARPTVETNSGNTSSGTVAEPTRRVPVEKQQVIVDKTTSDAATTKEIPPVKSISGPTIKGTVGNILNKGVTPTTAKETVATKEEIVVKDDTKSGEDSESKVVKTEVKPTAKRVTPTESKPLKKSAERSDAGIHPPPTLTNSSASTSARPTVNANSGNTSSGTVAEPTRRVPVEKQQVIVDKTTSDAATTKETPPVKSISGPTVKGTVGNILNKGLTPTATKETITTKEEVVVKDDTKSGEDSESKVVKTEVKPTAKRVTPTESKPLKKSAERSDAGIHPPPTLINSSASTSARPTVNANSGNTSSGEVIESTGPVKKQQVIVDKTTSDAATTKETPPIKSISGPTIKGTVGNILNKGLTPTASKETITTKEEIVVKDDTKSGEDSESKVVKTEVKPTAKRITPTESKPLDKSTNVSSEGSRTTVVSNEPPASSANPRNTEAMVEQRGNANPNNTKERGTPEATQPVKKEGTSSSGTNLKRTTNTTSKPKGKDRNKSKRRSSKRMSSKTGLEFGSTPKKKRNKK